MPDSGGCAGTMADNADTIRKLKRELKAARAEIGRLRALVGEGMPSIRDGDLLGARAVFDGVADPVFIFDNETHLFLDCNRAAVDRYGYSLEELRAMTPLDLHPPEEREQVRENLGSEDLSPHSYTHVNKSGEQFEVELHTNACMLGGKAAWVSVVRDITGRVEAERQLRLERAYLDRLFESAPEAIVVADNDGRVVRANKYFSELFGYSPEEMIGKPVDDLVAPGSKHDEASRITRDVAEGNKVFRETVRRRKDGSLVHVSILGTPVYVDEGQVAVYGIYRDITERKRVERALHLTQFAVDGAVEAIFWISQDGRFFYVNDSAARSLGYTREELLKLSVPDIDTQFSAAEWPVAWNEFRELRSRTFESVHCRKDGSEFPVEISMNFLDFDEREFICAFARDLTERKENEAERARLEAQVQHSQKLESLGVLAGGIAHDFNNLLVAILGNAGLALMDLSEDAAAREKVVEIERAAVRASELTDQMLAYAGKSKFDIKPINLNNLVEEMGHLLETVISKKATVTYDFAGDLPAIKGDPVQVRQIVMNLITNASESLADTPGAIKVSTGVVMVDHEFLSSAYVAQDLLPGEYVCLSVEDTGCGMDESTAQRIFDPFFTTKFTGRGLGLAAVLGIVRGHGGAIALNTTPGRGSSFRVLFPAQEASTKASGSTDVAQPAGQWRGEGAILVVDDEPGVRAVARTILERWGFEPVLAKDGAEGVDLFNRQPDHFRAVLLDLTMPGMNGLEVFEEIRRCCPRTPIILMSGYSEEDAASRFPQEGLQGFIHKPFQPAQLIEQIQAILS